MAPWSDISFKVTDKTAAHRLLGAFNIHVNDDEPVTKEDLLAYDPILGPDGNPIDEDAYCWYTYNVLLYDRKTKVWDLYEGGLLWGAYPDADIDDGAAEFVDYCLHIFCKAMGTEHCKFDEKFKSWLIDKEEWDIYDSAYLEHDIEKIRGGK